jgi:hypothetical protein
MVTTLGLNFLLYYCLSVKQLSICFDTASKKILLVQCNLVAFHMLILSLFLWNLLTYRSSIPLISAIITPTEQHKHSSSVKFGIVLCVVDCGLTGPKREASKP